MIHQLKRKRTVASLDNFYEKMWVGFWKSVDSSKNYIRDFQNKSPSKEGDMGIMILEILNDFITLNFKQAF